jgi:hypothetical protein
VVSPVLGGVLFSVFGSDGWAVVGAVGLAAQALHVVLGVCYLYLVTTRRAVGKGGAIPAARSGGGGGDDGDGSPTVVTSSAGAGAGAGAGAAVGPSTPWTVYYAIMAFVLNDFATAVFASTIAPFYHDAFGKVTLRLCYCCGLNHTILGCDSFGKVKAEVQRVQRV